MKSKIPCIVLAGGVNAIPLYEGYRPGHKALMDFHEKPFIEYVLEALVQSAHLKDHAGIVGPENEIKPVIMNYQFDFIPEGNTILESIFNALRHYKNEELVLITNADLPLISKEAIEEFVEKCFQEKSRYNDNVFISVVPKENFTGNFSRLAKSTSRFRDVDVCHGNLFMVNPRVLNNKDAVNRINAIYNARKSPIQSALATGLRVGISYVLGVHLLHILTMRQMAQIASTRFGVGFIPVISSYPEIAVDVDEPEDYKLICDVLKERREAEGGRHEYES